MFWVFLCIFPITLFVAWWFISQCLFSGDNPGDGIALDGRALGSRWGGWRKSYWNHLNAAPVGSITFLEKQKTRRGGERKAVDVVNQKQHILYFANIIVNILNLL